MLPDGAALAVHERDRVGLGQLAAGPGHRVAREAVDDPEPLDVADLGVSPQAAEQGHHQRPGRVALGP